MTLTTKNSSELNGPGKTGASSQNSGGKAGQSPRSNPVCLEVSVTIRSLPNEVDGSTQPFQEEGRTVIVFDNGAVLRSTSNMPVGQTVILSNPKGRDVVCRVAGGRNLPSVKGYVEVEFIEAVEDFWGIHQDAGPVASTAPPAVPLSTREAAAPPLAAPVHPMTPRPTAITETAAKPASLSLGSGPSTENVAGRVDMPLSVASRDSKTEPTRLGQDKVSKAASDYSSSAMAKPTSLANWDPPVSDHPVEKLAIPVKREASSITPISNASAPSHDFLSKGLMAYEQPDSSSSASSGRVPLIVGVAALALAGVCGVVFYIHRSSAPVPVAKNAVVSQPSTPQPPVANTAPEPAQTPQAEAAPPEAQTQMQAQPVVADLAQPTTPVGPIPAVATSPATLDSPADTRPGMRPDARNLRRPEKKTVAAKQPELPPARRPLIPNLKIGSPSAPSQTLDNQAEGSPPNAEIASTGTSGTVPPAGLLTSSGRTSNPPAPPPAAFPTVGSAPAVPAVTSPAPASATNSTREPKLLSSVRPAYPEAAKTSSIQGTVSVSASIDANGKVVDAQALSGPMLLRQSAVESVRQWKYSPGFIDGKPAPSRVTVSVQFRLN